jgi:hypothetical protein
MLIRMRPPPWGKRMRTLILAIVAFAALTTNAKTESCSQRMANCKSVNKTENPGAEGQARCEGYFQTCMATGTWTSRKATITGLTRK